MSRKEVLELAVQLFDIISSYDLSGTDEFDNDYLMTSIYYKLREDLEQEEN